MNKKNKIILTVAISSSMIGIATAGLVPSGPAEIWTIGAIAALTSTSIGAITAFGTAFSTSMQFNFERIISAVAVATKQEAMSANNVGEGMQKSAQVLVTAMKSQKQAEDIAQTTMNYAPDSGQGFQPCQTTKQNETLNQAFDAAEKNIGLEIETMDTDNKPGFMVKSKSEAIGDRLQSHYKLFCTKSEAKQGLCSESKLAGADINAAYLFKASKKDSDEDKARLAYIEHIMGEPDEPVEGNIGTNLEAKVKFMHKINKDALISIPAYSLQAVRLANLQQKEYQNYSPNQLLKARVNQYFGGEEANKWAGQLARQTERGLLVEALKMHGLETWLHQKQYQQNQRLEANLAALLVMDGKIKQQQLQQQYSKLATQNIQ
ncbi:MAG: hypothetical protein RLZZ210_1117 [Pseudomonadota bacterium]|jgi:hypothetical protein